MTDSGTKCAWVIHESKAVQIHAHNNRRCLYVPRVPGSVKNPHNNNNNLTCCASVVLHCDVDTHFAAIEYTIFHVGCTYYPSPEAAMPEVDEENTPTS